MLKLKKPWILDQWVKIVPPSFPPCVCLQSRRLNHLRIYSVHSRIHDATYMLSRRAVGSFTGTCRLDFSWDIPTHAKRKCDTGLL